VPDGVASQLGKQLIAAVKMPDNQAKLTKLGLIPVGAPAADLEALVSRETAFWGPVFKSSGFKP
jgi:tripartite-type tricarboxylate transporter receptor subunit TctC